MHSLKQEWEKLLKKPIKAKISQFTQEQSTTAPSGQTQPEECISQHIQGRIDLLRRKIQIYNTYIANLNSLIYPFNVLISQARKTGNIRSVKLYKMLIHNYQQSITKAQNNLILSLDRLNQLLNDY